VDQLSPDIEAYFCYVVVLVVGFFVALRQINSLLPLKGKWMVAGTWLLILAYTMVPVVLFWVLDRSGAIHDTSMLAAFLIALTYERILSGNSDSYTAPTAVSALWSPFLVYANKLVEKITDRVYERDKRYRRQLLAVVAGSDESYKALEQLALSRSADMPALQAELTKIDNQQTVIGERAAMEKKTAQLYRSLSSVDELDRQLLEKKVISLWIYLKWVKLIIRKTVFVLLGLAIIGYLAWNFGTLTGVRNQVDYYVWRLRKPDITDVDRHRAKVKIGRHLENEGSNHHAFARLTGALRYPALSTEQVNDIIGVLIANRCHSFSPKGFDLPTALTESLRVENADSRDRVNRALVYLGQEYGPVDSAMTDWNPAETNFDDLEKKIDEWRAFWNQHDNRVNPEKCAL